MSANDWERRVINRVPENTILNSENVLKFFDKELEKYTQGCGIFHNGAELKRGVDFELIENDEKAEIQLRRQLQPNDRFGVRPGGATAEAS